MTDIQPDARTKTQQAHKLLRRHLIRLRHADSLTAGQRDALFVEVLTDLIRIQSHTGAQSNTENKR